MNEKFESMKKYVENISIQDILDEREKSSALENKMLQILKGALLSIEYIGRAYASGDIDNDEYQTLIEKALLKREMIVLEVLEYDELNDTTLIPPPYNIVKIDGVNYQLFSVNHYGIK